MGSSVEDVLLMANHVKLKKSDGTLYLMTERIAWMPEGKDTFSISHKYADVKMQKISPDGKSKIQLQVVLHSGDTTTFHFVNPMGSESQLRDRNEIKELLQQLLPKFKRKVNKELEEKNKILQEDPELFQLYKDLVVSQVITAEEFWANHAPQRAEALKQKSQQDVGVSAAFLADIKPQTDGCNGLKYNITADIIESIFRTYPAVKRKHMENVPHKVSESEFWTRFFQSHYFHRDRLNLSSKDLFSECAKSDELDVKNALECGINDPLVDLNNFQDVSFEELGYGNTAGDMTKSQSANQSMIRRFNHHSMMVLRACQNQRTTTNSDPSSLPLANGTATPKQDQEKNNHHLQEPSGSGDCQTIKKARLLEKTEYEDLECRETSSNCTLNLTRIDRYLHGPTPMTDSDYLSREDILQAVSHQVEEISAWTPNLPQVLSSTAAITALSELSRGGALMTSVHQIHVKDTVPRELQQELKQVYTALIEVLRHFWTCFPTTTPQLEEKAIRMRATLERFQMAKLQVFQDRLLREHLSIELSSHMNDMLQAAYNKFDTWQTRRINQSRK